MNIIRYEQSHEKIWDKFVNEQSANGTFLQTRAFLNYHPEGRFKDCSLIILPDQDLYDIYAVVPACEYAEDGKKVFHSHLGSTFGGVVINSIRYNVGDIIDILDSLDKYLRENGYDKAILKLTPDIFCRTDSALLQYLLWNRGYEQGTELSTYIDYKTYRDDILSNFNRRKKRSVKKGQAQNLVFKTLETEDEITSFYDILCENLRKFDTTPVHTLPELFDLRQRLSDIIDFYGVYDNEKMVAGAMNFFFKNTNAFHVQYSGARQEISDYSPMSHLFYGLISHAKARSSELLSFGISTEQKGRVLNVDLITNKEAYGSSFSLNRTFYKELRVESEAWS